jgi:hypothetical protein
MKSQVLFILFVLIGCQKPKSESQITSTTPENKIQTVNTAEEKFLKTDTISISEEGETSKDNYILANLLEQKADKDSIVTSKFRLDFYQNKSKTASSKVTIENYEKGSEWSGSYGFADNTSDKNSSFIKIDFGYAACGYTHENYLFYLKEGNLQLVHQWQSMSDSGWGTWTEFISNKSEKEPGNFYCKTVSFEPGDDESEDSGIVTYSDSISFSFNGNRWKKQLLSAKDKPYFEKKMSFNEFHKIKS